MWVGALVVIANLKSGSWINRRDAETPGRDRDPLLAVGSPRRWVWG